MKKLMLALLALLIWQTAAAADNAALWAGLRAGTHVALMRHAQAPGVGDPTGFRLDDCRTQRNLSAEGKRQAARAGAVFRENGITRAAVYSSQWCRCLDTAAGLGLGPVTPEPALNSFFDNGGREKPQTQQLTALIARHAPGTPLVLVTHQVNITALIGGYVESGEIVVVGTRDGKPEVAGRIKPLQ
jgi:phosphohistidine phosphatase SixA